MIGTTYQPVALAAVLGVDHSPLVPGTLWSAWLDGTGTVIAMTGLTVPHSAFEVVAGVLTNTVDIDGGTCPATVPSSFALLDSATDGEVIASSPVTFADSDDTPVTPTEGEALTLAAGALAFNYVEE